MLVERSVLRAPAIVSLLLACGRALLLHARASPLVKTPGYTALAGLLVRVLSLLLVGLLAGQLGAAWSASPTSRWSQSRPFSEEVFSGFVSSAFVPFVGGLLLNSLLGSRVGPRLPTQRPREKQEHGGA
jgi:hypothetical protein